MAAVFKQYCAEYKEKNYSQIQIWYIIINMATKYKIENSNIVAS